jgi:hypothetical protein
MPVGTHFLYGVGAALDVALAVFLARKLSEGAGIVGPAVTLVVFASWALCVWLTPLGPALWRASALGFLVLGALLALSLAAERGVAVFRERRDVSLTARARRAFLVRCAWLILLLFMTPVIAHLASGGRVAVQQ